MIRRIEITETQARYMVARRALLVHLGAVVGALDEMTTTTNKTVALMEQAVVACRVLRDRIERARDQE